MSRMAMSRRACVLDRPAMSGIWPRRSELAPPTGQVPIWYSSVVIGNVGTLMHHRPANSFEIDPVETLLHHRPAKDDDATSFIDFFSFRFESLGLDLWASQILKMYFFSAIRPSLRRLGPRPALPGACRVDL